METASGAALQRPVWRNDEEVKECAGCGARFSVVLRKHHCRGCGDVFCAKCIPYRRPQPHLGYDNAVKLCQSCASPQVVSTTTIPCEGGELVIRGYNFCFFGVDKKMDDFLCSDVEITVAGKPCRDVRAAQHGVLHVLRCSAPPGIGRGQELTIRFMELEGSSLVNYAMPVIESVDPVPTKGGQRTVYAQNVGFAVEKLRVLANGQPAQVVKFKAPGVFVCLFPPGAGSDLPLQVTVEGTTVESRFSYAPPVLRDAVTVPASGGWVELRGRNLGQTGDQVIFFIDRRPLPAEAVRMTKPHSRLQVLFPFPPPDRRGKSVPIVVQVAGQRAEGKAKYHMPQLPRPPPLPDGPSTAGPERLAGALRELLAERRTAARQRLEESRRADQKRREHEQRLAQEEVARERREAARQQRGLHQRRRSNAERQMLAAQSAFYGAPPLTRGASAGGLARRGHTRSQSDLYSDSRAARHGRAGAAPAAAAPSTITEAGESEEDRESAAGDDWAAAGAALAPVPRSRSSSAHAHAPQGVFQRVGRTISALSGVSVGSEGRGSEGSAGRAAANAPALSRRTVRRRILRGGWGEKPAAHGVPLPHGGGELAGEAGFGAPADVDAGFASSAEAGVESSAPGAWESGLLHSDGPTVNAGAAGAEALASAEESAEADQLRLVVNQALRATLVQFAKLVRLGHRQRLLVDEETRTFVAAMRSALDAASAASDRGV